MTEQRNWVDKLIYLDRRWIFLLMGLAVLTPILFPRSFRFPEIPSPLVESAFEELDELEPGSRVLISFDYDPGSIAELHPMAKAFMWHAAKNGHKVYTLCLWPLGKPLMNDMVDRILLTDFGPGADTEHTYVEGENIVVFGYAIGAEIAIRQLATNMRQVFPSDRRGVSVDDIPAMQGVRSVQDMDLIVTISAGLPGTKEWVQYAGTPYDKPVISGCTGVQAPQLYPYYPDQLQGLLGAIKGAAEYETLLQNKYDGYGKVADAEIAAIYYTEGQIRMGPQLVAHVLILFLIIGGNILLFIQHRRRRSGA